MKYQLIDWVDAKLRTWGFDRRRLRRSKYPPSPAGRADQPIGYGGEPEPMEVLTGDALLVGTAIKRALEDHAMPIKYHAVLYLHYDDRYRRMPAAKKCRELSVGRQGYYHILAQAHRKIDAYWPTDLEAKITKGG